MSDQTRIVTALGKAEHDRILVRGYDLNKGLLGKITFGQMTFLMLMGRLPTSDEARMIDSMLIALVDHGMTAGAIAAISSDMGLPWQMAKTFALLGRALGGIAHIGEEIRRPMARNISALIKSALIYEPNKKA